jgi:hypothetical protein
VHCMSVGVRSRTIPIRIMVKVIKDNSAPSTGFAMVHRRQVGAGGSEYSSLLGM